MDRTITILRIINIIVDISFFVSCRPMERFAMIPLRSNATLWQAHSLDKWESEMERCYQGRKIYGLWGIHVLLTKLHVHFHNVQVTI